MPFNSSESESESRVSQKSYTKVRPRPTRREVEDLIRNADALYPGLPATHFPEKVSELAEAEFLAALDEGLRSQYLIRVTREMRMRDRRHDSGSGWLFPGIRTHAARLPEFVPIGNGETKERGKLNYKDLGRHLKVLRQENRARHQKEIAATVALRQLWPPRTKDTKGYTLDQVDKLKAREAGLI